MIMVTYINKLECIIYYAGVLGLGVQLNPVVNPQVLTYFNVRFLFYINQLFLEKNHYWYCLREKSFYSMG